MLWKLTPTRDTLHKFLPRQYASADCQVCPQDQAPVVETLYHALGDCPANCGLTERLLQVIRAHQPGATLCTVLTLNLVLEPSLELPMTWVIGTVLNSIFSQREEGRVSIVRTKADVESSCCLNKECSAANSLANAYTLSTIIVRDLFLGV